MARRPRLQYCGAIHHVMSRGNRKSLIFEDDRDRRRFLAILTDAVERYGVRCIAYCLMGNHYHLVLEVPRANLSRTMQHVNGVYARYSNRRHGRIGHVFGERYKSPLVGDDIYLRGVVGYVVLNPIVAKLVTDPSEWCWSSYRATAGLDAPPSFLDMDWLEPVFGCRTRAQSQVRYRAFINGVDVWALASQIDLEADLVGAPAFEALIRSYVGIALHQKHVPRAYRSLGRSELAELFKDVGCRKTERDHMIRRAHVVHGYQLSEIARYLGLHPNTMSKVLRRLRERRNQGTTPVDD